MMSRRNTLAVLALAKCLSAAAASAIAPQAYTCTELNVPGSTSTQLWRLNNSGFIAADSILGPYIYNPNNGVWTPLPAPPASSGYAATDLGVLDVNDNGTIVGAAQNNNVNNGLEEGFILGSITNPASYSFFVYADPNNPNNNNAEFRGINNNGLIAGWALSSGTFTGAESSATAFVFNPGNTMNANYPPGFTAYQPTLSDGSLATLTILSAVNSAGVFAGSTQSNSIAKEGVLIPNSLATVQVPNSSFLLALRGINDADPQSAGNCDQGSCVRAAGWGISFATGAELSFTLDYDPQTGYVQTPQIIDCSAQIPASANVLVMQGINNSNTVTGGYIDTQGNSHGVIAYPSTTAPAGTCSAGAGGCDLSHGVIPHSVTGGPNPLPGTVTENSCKVLQDPRIVQFGSCTGHSLPVAQVCPGFGNTVIPDTMCGGSGPSGSGFELINTQAEGVDGLSGIYVQSEAFANVALGGSPPTCPQTVVGWAPRSASTVEGVVPEGNDMLELTSGCGSSKTGSRGLSIYGVGLTLNTAALPGATLQEKLRGFTAEKYVNLYKSIAEGNMTRAERLKVNACVAVSELLFATRNLCPAVRTIADCDALVARDVAQFSASPSDPNVWGDIRGRLANLYLTINTRELGNAPNTTWPPNNLPSCH